MDLVFDIETDGLLEEATKVHCICVASTDGEFSVAVSSAEGIEDALMKLAAADTLIGHNILKFDIPCLKKLYPGWKPKGEVFDTLVASRLIWPDISTDLHLTARKRNPEFPPKLSGSHGLEAWGFTLGMLKGDYGKHEGAWDHYTPDMLEYCARDVELNVKLYELILEQGYSKEALDLEHEFARIIFDQEMHGFPFDVAGAQQLYAKLAGDREKTRTELVSVFEPTVKEMKRPQYYTLTADVRDIDHTDGELGDASMELEGDYIVTYQGTRKADCEAKRKELGLKPKEVDITPGPPETREIPFNPSSRLQISQRLIAKHGWRPTKFTPGGQPEVSEKIIAVLPYPEAEVLGRFLRLEKRLGQLSEGDNSWLKLVGKDNRIHGAVITNGTPTGRCRHHSPNVAQAPTVRVEYGTEMRGLFTALDGYSLVGWDASGLELRCLAHYLARYDGGEYSKILLEGDVHTANQKAAGLATRDQAKTFIYAFIYGAADKKIGTVVGKGARAGKELRAAFLKKFPAIERLKKDVERTVKTRGFLKGLDGRHIKPRSEHATLNTLLQCAGALVMKKATVLARSRMEQLDGRVWQYGHKGDYDVAKVADIHDECQYIVKTEHAPVIGGLLVGALKDAGLAWEFRCPLDGEYKIGNNWAETH